MKTRHSLLSAHWWVCISHAPLPRVELVSAPDSLYQPDPPSSEPPEPAQTSGNTWGSTDQMCQFWSCVCEGYAFDKMRRNGFDLAMTSIVKILTECSNSWSSNTLHLEKLICPLNFIVMTAVMETFIVCYKLWHYTQISNAKSEHHFDLMSV